MIIATLCRLKASFYFYIDLLTKLPMGKILGVGGGAGGVCVCCVLHVRIIDTCTCKYVGHTKSISGSNIWQQFKRSNQIRETCTCIITKTLCNIVL